MTLRAEDTGNAAAFTSTDHNLSCRPTTIASRQWEIDSWSTVGEAGSRQRTPDLSGIVQEVVSRGDWISGNAMAFFVSGSGERTAESFKGESNAAPLLHIEYVF